MQGLSYYLLYPFIWGVSRLPFPLLYRFSDFLFLILFRLMGYRRAIVWKNLRNAFPEKTEEELLLIQKQFYRYLCDLVVETAKTLTWTEREVRARVRMHRVDLLDRLFERGKNIIIVMGHQGNWEWAGPSFSLSCRHQLLVVYKPLSNPYFERILSRARTKFSTRIIPIRKVMRGILADTPRPRATALIADQAPNPVSLAHWMRFLNQETAVNTGPEKIARKMGWPVVFMEVRRPRRGYYEIIPHLLAEQADNTAVLTITEKFNRILEACIRKQPETWLWSHRRWKHEPPRKVEDRLLEEDQAKGHGNNGSEVTAREEERQGDHTGK